MSKKVIDWDDLRTEMLERSDVKAAVDAQDDGDDRQQRDNQHGQFYRPAKAL